MKKDRDSQLARAYILGIAAQAADKPRAPAFDEQIDLMLAGRKVGETPAGEASTVEICESWHRGYTVAILS